MRRMMDNMEQEIGLSVLTRTERDVLLAFCDGRIEGGELASSERARSFPAIQSMSQPTFHRILKKLIHKGFIQKPEGAPLGIYRVAHPLPT